MIRLFLILIFSAGAAGTYYLLFDGYGGPFDGFINNYALEICVVIVAYFMSVLFKKISGNKFAKAIIIFILASCIEVAQYFDLVIFGSQFDPLDFVFYASALSFALFVDIQVVPRLDGSYEKIKF